MAEQTRLAKTRRYTLRQRATAMDRTHDRITKAAIELHGSVGPAATTMSAVAERAGVTRATLYRHFPDEATLFAACSADWLAAHPRPDPANLPAGDREARLAAALDAVYAWYRADAPMRANLLRDADVFPPAIRAGIRSFPDTFVAALASEWGSARGAEAGLSIRLPQSPLWARLSYVVDQSRLANATRTESVQSVVLAIEIAARVPDYILPVGHRMR